MKSQLVVFGIFLLLSSVEAASLLLRGAVNARMQQVKDERQHYAQQPLLSTKEPEEELLILHTAEVQSTPVVSRPKSYEYTMLVDQPFLQQSRVIIDKNQNYIEGPNNIVDGFRNTVIGSGNIVGVNSLPFL